MASNAITYLLKNSIKTQGIHQGKSLHARIIRTGFRDDTILNNMLMEMYLKCGNPVSAERLLYEMPNKNSCSWTIMVSYNAKNGHKANAMHFFKRLLYEDFEPNGYSFSSILPVCSSKELPVVHGQILRSGYDSDVFVENALIDLYAKSGKIDFARKVFDKMRDQNRVSWSTMISAYARECELSEAMKLLTRMPEQDIYAWTAVAVGYVNYGNMDEGVAIFNKMPSKDIVAWNAMISGLVQNGYLVEALDVFKEMQALFGISCDGKTLGAVLPACPHKNAVAEIHSKIVVNGYRHNMFLHNSLLNMYAKCGSILNCRKVFERMFDRDIVSWTSIISGYVKNGHEEEALRLYNEMCNLRLRIDSRIFSTVLPACGGLRWLEKGKRIHEDVIVSGFGNDSIVLNSLIDMYAKCGDMLRAHEIFDAMHVKDVVSWTTMISGYVQCGLGVEALKLFHEMRVSGVCPNSKTFVSILPGISDVNCLHEGIKIVASVVKLGLLKDVSVCNAIMGMYARCGDIRQAMGFFEKMQVRDVVSWTAIISELTHCGCASEALDVFQRMWITGIEPDSMTIASVLSACTALASLEHGLETHRMVVSKYFHMDTIVGNALLDMYAKCGSISQSRLVFDQMHRQNLVTWTSMISAYAMNGLGRDALSLFYNMKHCGVDPEPAIFVCILSACSHSGLVEEGFKCFNAMKDDYNITPSIDHYSCMVDLLGRAGRLNEAYDFVSKIPVPVDISVWKSLLASCRIHNNVELAKCVADRIFKLYPEDIATFVLLSNIYAAAGGQGDIERSQN